MRFSEFFRLGKSQAELDFVDVNPDRDTRLFVDPYAIEIRDDELSSDLAYHIKMFFEDVLRCLRSGQNDRATQLVSNLTEPQETFLGMSRGKPQGRGVGPFQADMLLYALRNSRAFQTGLLQDISETELFIEGFGPDKISDLSTNLIRGPLIAYTADQCKLHRVPLHPQVAVAPVWDPEGRIWRTGYHDLPVIDGKPIILVPKVVTRLRLSLNSQEYYNGTILNHLRAEHLEAGTGLVKILTSKKRRGERVVWKKDVKKEHPFSKSMLAEITKENPRLLEFYKTLKGAQGALSAKGMDPELSETALSEELIHRLTSIPSGAAAATAYQDCIAAVLVFLFYPDLISPKLEEPIHDGRKRIDIVFTNYSQRGFFATVRTSPQTRARYVIIECKNYSDDIRNPEFDQLAGRFSPVRGQFGMMLCRTVENEAVALKRCRDAAGDHRGVIIVLSDIDIIDLLNLVSNGRRSEISAFLERKHRAVLM